MSRIGKQPIAIPDSVTVTIANGLVAVKGPKGELSQQLHPLVSVAQTGSELNVSVGNANDKKQRSLWGLWRKLIANMVTGVTEGFSKQLEINGVGYKAVLQGDKLVITVGYSHPVEYSLPEGLTAKVEKNLITISGADKQLVGQAAAEIRSVRKPEPYKGKGIKYVTEIVRRKAGKTAAKGE
ncbi:MAG: 50S ribosomal protein L6 [Candidatus Buchananbacteria bacterium RIFCSPLOWO2_01_FULL_56_15]|uniref:Large ribosomal subunit protein uL6 n=2 Tax=Candidatus Buchananiibacteriota TaxID=1817903 RepID=A0A1G1YJL4_9BACT|nr:MAG: 50S ribosomal protein L6 [Candidatus Buchananbacteria bacterium RIFCSPHIGHO2_02_FULL_56_16]OGY54901.1 MAG: 50S ribosomal protein L6 [Candidatus Buchananbacteria bacterium RIFCSPLOWO2_01_FULL_56_15]